MIYFAIGVLTVVAVMIACAQFNLWALRPVVYQNLALEDLAPYVRSWGPWLTDRSRIVVRHTQTDAEIELRKQRFSTAPDKVVLRVRHADKTKKHFHAIQKNWTLLGLTTNWN